MAVSRLVLGGLLSAALSVSAVGAASAETFKVEGEMKPAFIYFNVKTDRGWWPALDERPVKVGEHPRPRTTDIGRNSPSSSRPAAAFLASAAFTGATPSPNRSAISCAVNGPWVRA